MQPVVLSWSSGKDSAMALYELRKSGEYEVVSLLTTVSSQYGRVSMHGVRVALLKAQAESLGIPLDMIPLSGHPSNEEYENKMRETLQCYKNRGINKIAFGDIFLEDLRAYRQNKLSAIGMQALFPLWKRDTGELFSSIIASGFKSVITCVDTEALSMSFAGRIIDRTLQNDLPATVDACGENGEYHSFTYAGPLFRSQIGFEVGEKVLRDNRFYYCDLIPA